jgi:hypothetical protein
VNFSLARRITLLRIVLGLVIANQSLRTALEPAPTAGTHLAAIGPVVRALAAIEVLAAVLLLPPWTARVGAWLLLTVIAVAVALHLLHGDLGVTWLLVAAAALWVVLGTAPGGASDQPV